MTDSDTDRRMYSNTLTMSSIKQKDSQDQGMPAFNHIVNFKGQKNTILVPLYVRACLRQLVTVSIKDQSVIAKFDFYVTFPLGKNDDDVYKNLGLSTNEAQELQQYMKNNITLEIGGTYVNIAPDAQVNRPQQPDYDREYIKMVIQEQFFDKDEELEKQLQEQEQKEAEESTLPFFYKRLLYAGQRNYITYLISGQFKCQGNLNSYMFPYHEVLLQLAIKTMKLVFRDITIKYNLMRLAQDEKEWEVSQFAFGPELPELGKFGIYDLNLHFRKVEGKKEQEESAYNENGCQNMNLIRDIIFSFKVHSVNVPFIIRNQVPLWILCFASFALNFALVSSIANIFGNIILISVAQISLLSNFRKSEYKTEYGGLYELTLSTFIVVSLFQFIVETHQFYSKKPAMQMAGDKRFQQASYMIVIILLILNFVCLLVVSCHHKCSKRTKEEVKKEEKMLHWNAEDYKSCVPFTPNKTKS